MKKLYTKIILNIYPNKFVDGLSPLIMNYFSRFQDLLPTSEIFSLCIPTIKIC